MLKLLPAVVIGIHIVFGPARSAWSTEVADLVKEAQVDPRAKAPHILNPPNLEVTNTDASGPRARATVAPPARLLNGVVPPIPNALKALEADVPCITCAQIHLVRPMDPEMIQQVKDYLEGVEREQKYKKKAAEIAREPLAPLPNVGASNDNEYAYACRKFIPKPPNENDVGGFINEDGSVGPWGNIVVKAINELAPDCLLGPSSDEIIANPNSLDRMIKLRDVCPNFRYFDKPRREHFYAYAFASIAMTESSCEPNATAPGKHGTAAGLMGMEGDVKHRDAAKIRKAPCYPNPEDGLMSPTNNLRCAVSVMSVDACGFNGDMMPRAKINDGSGYWERLRNNSRATTLIKQYPQCFD